MDSTPITKHAPSVLDGPLVINGLVWVLQTIVQHTEDIGLFYLGSKFAGNPFADIYLMWGYLLS